MRIIGIDPGIATTGFAILEMDADKKIKLLDVGAIITDKKNPFSNRLNAIATDLKTILRQWKPAGAGIEQVFFSKNVKTAIKVSHARGVILETLEEYGIPVVEFNPMQVKNALTGDSKADKLQMKKMVQCLLGRSVKNDDMADAIACGMALLATHSTQTNKQ